MKRQTIIWMCIGALFMGVIGTRAAMGKMGRIYVAPNSVAKKRETVPVPPWAPAETKPEVVWTSVPVPPDAIARGRVWSAEQGAEFGWTTWRQVDATTVFKERAKLAADPALKDPGYELSWPRTIGLWLAALFTLAAFSFLYRDNPFYKLTEAIVVGVSAAYAMIVGFWSTLVPKLFGAVTPWVVHEFVNPRMDPVEPAQRVSMILALILCVMLLMQLVPKVRWMSIWPLAFVVGTFAGLKLVANLESDFLAQIRATFERPPILKVTADPSGVPFTSGAEIFWQSFFASLKNSLLVIGTLCTLVYFFFSLEHKGATGKVARLGIWFLMITFGAAFGYTVMGRVTLLSQRFQFLFDDWLWLIDPAGVHQVTSAVPMVFFGFA